MGADGGEKTAENGCSGDRVGTESWGALTKIRLPQQKSIARPLRCNLSVVTNDLHVLAACFCQ